MANARGRRFRACSSLLHAALLSQLLATVLGNSKGPMTTFELQTNLVSCGTEAAPAAAASAIAVCSPPESKLFGNIKIVSGTPHPGSTGVRGRLYDVGKLCDSKVAEKIDRAWIAFLDCDGCALATKLANLQSSNPQAILIYNQTSCVFPSPPPAPARAPGAPQPATSSSSSSPVSTPPPASTSVFTTTTTTTQVPTPASTPPADSNNEGHNDSGDGDDAKHHADPDDGGSKEDPGEGGDDENKASLRLIRKVQDTTGQKRTLLQLLFRRDETVARTATVVDPSESVIKYGTAVAMAEQVTIDYLFQILLGPASYAPLPAALRSLKTLVPQHKDTAVAGAGAGAAAAGHVQIAGLSSTTDTITDLMVSISPSTAEPVAPEPRFVSMSKPIFAAVIGVLCAVVCGVILVYVARPLILRHRRKHRPTDSDLVEPTNNDGHNNNNNSANGKEGSVDTDSSCHKNELREGDDNQPFHFSDFKRDNSSGFRSQGDLAYSQRPVLIPVHGDKTEKYRAALEDNNQAPAVYGQQQQQQHALEGNGAGRDPGLGHPDSTNTEDDEHLQAQRLLRQLRQQQQQQQPQPQEAIKSNLDEPDGYTPPASLMRSRSGNFLKDEPQSGLPAWRQSNQARSHTTSQPQLTSLRMPRTWANSSQDNHNHNDHNSNDVCLSATSSRNGGDLFHSPTRKTPMPPSAPSLPPMIETDFNHSTQEGGLATALYRQRIMAQHHHHHDDPHSPIRSPSVQRSPLVGDLTSASSFERLGSATAARPSTHDLVGPPRVSLDQQQQQHRRDIQSRFQEITGSSRPAAAASSASLRADGTTSTPRASFSDDFASDSRRPSLELLRARYATGS
ncbi:hypothetical protein EC968_001339 [Mortierella alpina]|nr:hypothetical protein EC968_001339 [Mortierella alpina]